MILVFPQMNLVSPIMNSFVDAELPLAGMKMLEDSFLKQIGGKRLW